MRIDMLQKVYFRKKNGRDEQEQKKETEEEMGVNKEVWLGNKETESKDSSLDPTNCDKKENL